MNKNGPKMVAYFRLVSGGVSDEVNYSNMT